MLGSRKLVGLRLYNKNVLFGAFRGGVVPLHPDIITQPPLVFKNNIHHKVTLILCCSDAHYPGIQRPLPPQNIHKLMMKMKPQQARQRLKVQALNQRHATAEEGLRIVNSELETMAWARNQQILLQLDEPHSTRMQCEIVDIHGEPLLTNNQELYSVMVQMNWTPKTRALTNMQIEWRPKSAGKWHSFQWDAILHCPTAEGHRAVPS